MKNIFSIHLLSFTILLMVGCSDLTEQVIDESLTVEMGDNVNGFIAPAYGPLSDAFTEFTNFALQLVSTDQGILPARGSGNFLSAGYIELYKHNTRATNGVVSYTWNAFTLLISRTVTAIENLTPLAATNQNAAKGLNEIRALRAYYNLVFLDNWGIVFKKDSSDQNSVILRRGEAVSYIESEFLAVVDKLDDSTGPGRITKSAVNGFLAQLYLNAAVYRNPYEAHTFSPSDMDKVIEYSTKVINSGNFSLSPEYFAIFDDNNHSNKELIFAIDQRSDLTTSHNIMSYWSLSESQYPLTAFPMAKGGDGPAITSDFYNTWVEAYDGVDPAQKDARFFKENLVIPQNLKNLTGINPTNDANHYFLIDGNNYEINRGIIRGVQWGLRNSAAGQPFEKIGSQFKIFPIIEQRNGFDKYVDHVIDIDLENPENSDYADGYRVEKYHFGKSSNEGRFPGDADIVLLRLADIYLMRAEAELRKGNNALALADINIVRSSRTARPKITPPPLKLIDLNILYRERGFEFYWEGSRRSDMIRFGHFEDSYTSKSNADVKKRLFPIPQAAIDAASNALGYLTQNEGY